MDPLGHMMLGSEDYRYFTSLLKRHAGAAALSVLLHGAVLLEVLHLLVFAVSAESLLNDSSVFH